MQIFYSTLLRVFNQYAFPPAPPSKKCQQHYKEILSLKHAKGRSETENQVNSGRKYQKNTHAYDMEHWGVGQGGIYARCFESTTNTNILILPIYKMTLNDYKVVRLLSKNRILVLSQNPSETYYFFEIIFLQHEKLKGFYSVIL